MKALEFKARVGADSTVKIPDEFADRVHPHESVRVILLVGEDEDRDWNRLTAEQFLEGYAESDAIYDDLPTR